ncbi:MAG: endonuclease MutS2, partial [Chloroflexota bacterium]|nr:endonuclease MutS2 [Chloroflexota bacterium]
MNLKTLEILEYRKILARLANYCDFNASRDRALDLLPTTDIEQAQNLQAKTAEAFELFTDHPQISIGGARDLNPITEDAVRGLALAPDALLDVKYTLTSARNLKRFFWRLESGYPQLKTLANSLPPSLGLIDSITKAISDKGSILDSASERLENIRRDLKIQQQRLRTRMESMINNSQISQYLQDGIFTQRDGRYVLPLKSGAKGKIRGIIHDQSASGATLYIEPERMVEHNNRYRQLQLDERDEEHRILAELTHQVAEHAEILRGMVEILADIDLTFARAKYAEAINGISPTFHPFPASVDGRHPGVVLRFYGARHPLLDPEEVVPIDVQLDPQTYALIITGPNTGGKTVTLKTVGLLALMAQTGLHIPASPGTEFSLFHDIYADIGDEQSIEQSLSTFSGHITNIIHILEKADRQSLVLMDELGAGTDPQEGAALARALMTYLLEKGITTLVTTHHPEMKAYAHFTPGVVNASMEFDLETLKPTYYLTVGLPGRSNALAIAGRLGLPQAIIEKAREELNPADLKADDLLNEIYRQRNLARESRLAADKARDEAKEMRSELIERLKNIEDERLKMVKRVRREALAEVEILREELGQMRQKMEEAQQVVEDENLAEVEEKIARVEADISEPVERQVTEIPRPRYTGPVVEGGRVYVQSLGQKGIVKSIN